MNRIAVALAAAALVSASPAAAQDLAGPVAAAVDQFGQGMADAMTGGPGLFITAQGHAPLPASSAAPMTVTIKGSGTTAVEAVADRNARLERVRAVANRFDVGMEVGTTHYAIGEDNPWASPAAPWAAAALDEAEIEEFATDPEPAADRTVTASVQVRLERPNETRLPDFVDALAEAGVENLDDSLNGLDLGQLQPFLALLGLDMGRDPGEAVWNEAAADAVRNARGQAAVIAEASGRTLGPVRYVSVLMRSHDGDSALVTVAVRFGFAD